MRIVFLSDDFPPESFGGAGISTFDLARGVKKAGHDVFVVTTCRDKEEAGETNYQGLVVFKIASNYPEEWKSYLSLFNPPAIRSLRKILRELKPDVVHVNNVHNYLSYHSIKVAKRHAKGVIVTLRDAMSFSFGKLQTKKYLDRFDGKVTWFDQIRQSGKRWNPFRNFVVRYYLGQADRLLSVSAALKTALEQNGITKVEVVHTGLDISEWQEPRERAESFKQKHSLKDKKVIFFGGRLSSSKGAQIVLDVMERVVVRFPQTVLLVAGTKLQTRVPDFVKFTGWIDREEIKSAYACSDIVLVPSICFDAFPRTVIEGMAAGRAVVGTCYGGAPEAIVDEVTGYVINPFEKDILAQKIIKLLSDPSLTRRFGQAGNQRIKETFDLDDKIRQMISYYQTPID